MARKPLGPCRVSSCPGRATHGRYCELHAEKYRVKDERPSAARRGYDRAWRRIRARYLRRYPDCVVCGRLAEEVDHIVPLAAGGTHEEGNLQALCKVHHSQKTAVLDGGFGRGQGGGM